jgi:Aldo/keto reductase family
MRETSLKQGPGGRSIWSTAKEAEFLSLGIFAPREHSEIAKGVQLVHLLDHAPWTRNSLTGNDLRDRYSRGGPKPRGCAPTEPPRRRSAASPRLPFAHGALSGVTRSFHRASGMLRGGLTDSVAGCFSLPASNHRLHPNPAFFSPKPCVKLLKRWKPCGPVRPADNRLPFRILPIEQLKPGMEIAMKPCTRQPDRREFIRHTGQAALVVAASAGIPAAADETEKRTEPAAALPVRALGRTGLRLPILGFGGAALPTMWGNPLSRAERVNLVRYAYDRGLRYFDTSPVYRESEEILGDGLRGRPGDICLVTKVETTKPSEVRASIEQSLRKLQTDYLDIALIHGTPGLEQMTVREAMAGETAGFGAGS